MGRGCGNIRPDQASHDLDDQIGKRPLHLTASPFEVQKSNRTDADSRQLTSR
jgi:hypothetical protein